MSKLIDLTGRRYGRLTVLGRAGTYKPPDDWSHPMPTWRCRCDCGNETIVIGSNLKYGRSTSCGCARHKRRKHEKDQP